MPAPRILIIDDALPVLASLSAILRIRLNAIVDTARSADEAVPYVWESDYDAILCDIVLPGVNGLQLLEHLHELRPDVPILLMTGYKQGDWTLQALRKGAFDFIEKPLEVEYFIASLKRAIHVRQLRRQVYARTKELEAVNEQLRGEIAARIQQEKRLARSNAALEQFAALVSHDLKEPLRMVASYVRLWATRYKGRFDTDADDFIQFATQGVTRMETLIHDLLTYSQVGSEQHTFKRIDCEVLLERVLLTLDATIAETGAAITHGPLPEVVADARGVVQVFEHLLVNAMKFRSSDLPRIHISAKLRNRKEGGQEWIFSLRDNGIGIDPLYAKRIFVIFQRLHGPDEYPGTGVGLAICKKIIEDHNGQIWVESELGSGANVCFTIPRPSGTP